MVMVSPISADQSEVEGWVADFKRRSLAAEQASAKWEARKAWLKDYMKVNAVSYASEKQRRDKAANDWALNDAMDTYNWNRREANRLANKILVNQALIDAIVKSQDRRDAGAR